MMCCCDSAASMSMMLPGGGNRRRAEKVVDPGAATRIPLRGAARQPTTSEPSAATVLPEPSTSRFELYRPTSREVGVLVRHAAVPTRAVCTEPAHPDEHWWIGVRRT